MAEKNNGVACREVQRNFQREKDGGECFSDRLSEKPPELLQVAVITALMTAFFKTIKERGYEKEND
jgi:hypothetical protein